MSTWCLTKPMWQNCLRCVEILATNKALDIYESNIFYKLLVQYWTKRTMWVKFFSFYIELYLTDICFLLKFQLLGEFEMVTCSGTCRKFMDNWVTHVPLILKYAVRTKTRNDAVSKVFQTYQESDILNSFGNESNFYFRLIFANFVWLL